MAPRFPTETDPRAGETPQIQIERVMARLERTERRMLQVENALSGVANHVGGLSIGGPCPDCTQSLLLVSQGSMNCPQCSYQEPL